jgi:hypothetical protein
MAVFEGKPSESGSQTPVSLHEAHALKTPGQAGQDRQALHNASCILVAKVICLSKGEKKKGSRLTIPSWDQGASGSTRWSGTDISFQNRPIKLGMVAILNNALMTAMVMTTRLRREKKKKRPGCLGAQASQECDFNSLANADVCTWASFPGWLQPARAEQNYHLLGDRRGEGQRKKRKKRKEVWNNIV